ncbi:exodeoxyribonuclease III [Herbiconiux moechotypicola]|uniref:Exodeoxyribonuclease III n=1 Tax=Herbiconiux moechotypicola TaxID=637393 RepID=A0ABP5Q3R1_9MICO|nr:exodeoxyribonuclease III [Herbiconiux moechotypicola]MCS5729063.1 exodeoxyribonuclease III [Herbiconiux moechotypicola]
MRVATWNVNSIRARVGRVTDWLVREDVDVLAMQEIKCRESQFPFEAFHEAGYEVVLHGLNQWNGVAFASRLPMTDVANTFTGMPGFGKPLDDGSLPLEARALGVTVEGVRLWSLYVPNGRLLDDPHYHYKLVWLHELAEQTKAWLAAHPDTPLALMGDWNIAPLDTDVWDMGAFVGSTHVSAPERAAFAEFEQLGLADVVRPLVPTGYTYWDYKQLRFPRNEGMRIDFIMGSKPFAELVTDARIERNERKGDAPSDHVPVVVDLELTPEDDDDRPMIFG